jgi:glycosyltransferase involved in cell wall biosynthesis
LDVHVLASRSEGASPFAILEAGSCDTVNIGSDIPGIRNLIEPNVTGACFPSGDVLRLTAEMGRLLTDSSLRSTFVEAFRARVLPNYTASAMLEGYLQGYTQMMLDSWVTSRE